MSDILGRDRNLGDGQNGWASGSNARKGKKRTALKASRLLGCGGSVKLPLSFSCLAKARLGGGVDIKLAEWLKEWLRRGCRGDVRRLAACVVIGENGCTREVGGETLDWALGLPVIGALWSRRWFVRTGAVRRAINLSVYAGNIKKNLYLLQSTEC